MIYRFLNDTVYEDKGNFVIHQLCIHPVLQSMDFELASAYVEALMTVFLNMYITYFI